MDINSGFSSGSETPHVQSIQVCLSNIEEDNSSWTEQPPVVSFVLFSVGFSWSRKNDSSWTRPPSLLLMTVFSAVMELTARDNPSWTGQPSVVDWISAVTLSESLRITKSPVTEQNSTRPGGLSVSLLDFMVVTLILLRLSTWVRLGTTSISPQPVSGSISPCCLN